MMRNKYHLSFRDMNKVFSLMPDDLRMRYTAENLSKVLKVLENNE